MLATVLACICSFNDAESYILSFSCSCRLSVHLEGLVKCLVLINTTLNLTLFRWQRWTHPWVLNVLLVLAALSHVVSMFLQALSSAYMPIGAVLVSPEITEVIYSQSNKLGMAIMLSETRNDHRQSPLHFIKVISEFP